MCKSGLFSVAVLAFVMALSGCAMNDHHHDDHDDNGEQETPVTMEQLPAAVKNTLTKEAGSGKVEEVEKMTKNGRTMYEADVMLDGKKWEIMVRDDGQLIKKELDEEKDDEDEKREKSEKR